MRIILIIVIFIFSLQSLTKAEKVTSKHHGDKTGKTKVTEQIILTSNNDRIIIACYDWSQESGNADQLRISIRTSAYDSFLLNAY